MIIINMLTMVDGKPRSIEHARFENGKVTGKINITNITREEVLDQFNRGHYRTSEV